MTHSSRLEDIKRFYEILDELRERIGGPKTLAETLRAADFPDTGVYFFFEPGEVRDNSGSGMRVVRVGIGGEGNSLLVDRLRLHKSSNIAGSSFRKAIHDALENRGGIGSGGKERVNRVIHAMPFLWLGVDRKSLRYMERNCIALLSGYNKPAIDTPSSNWLGHHSPNEKIQQSGLWNSDDVEKSYDPHFLDKLEELVKKTRRSQV